MFFSGSFRGYVYKPILCLKGHSRCMPRRLSQFFRFVLHPPPPQHPLGHSARSFPGRSVLHYLALHCGSTDNHQPDKFQSSLVHFEPQVCLLEEKILPSTEYISPSQIPDTFLWTESQRRLSEARHAQPEVPANLLPHLERLNNAIARDAQLSITEAIIEGILFRKWWSFHEYADAENVDLVVRYLNATCRRIVIPSKSRIAC